MTFDANERSAQSGAPVELYAFSYGVHQYLYTSADADHEYQSKTYLAKTINRGAIEHTAEKARSSLRVTVARDLDVLDLFKYTPPAEVVNLVVHRMHRGDADGTVLWMGRVLNVSWEPDAAVIYCEPVYTSIKRPGLRRHYQKQCPHVLYSSQCGVSAASYRQDVTVSAIGVGQITVTGLTGADGYFNGGYVEWEFEPGLYERRAIRGHTGGDLALTYPIRTLPQGATVSVYPGCDHTLATCASRFTNNLNYGGMPYIPTKNPFDGTPIY